MSKRCRAVVLLLTMAVLAGCKSSDKPKTHSDAGGGDAATSTSKDSGPSGANTGVAADAAAAADSGKPAKDAGSMDDAGGYASVLLPGKHDIAYALDNGGIDERYDVSTTWGASGALIGYVAPSTSGNEAPTLGTNQVSDIGGDYEVTVGRWAGGASGGKFWGKKIQPLAHEGFHYAVGVRTAKLPTTGTTTYDLLAATSPTIAGGAFAPGSAVGAMKVDWTTTPPTVGIDASVTIPGDGTYNVTTNGALASPSFSEVVVGGSLATSFAVDYANSKTLLLTSTGSACTDPTDAGTAVCSADVDGLFFGPSADHAAFALRIGTSGASGQGVHVALAFKKH